MQETQVSNLQNEMTKLQRLMGMGGITHTSADIHSARVISFASLGERDRVWLETDLKQYQGENPRVDDLSLSKKSKTISASGIW